MFVNFCFGYEMKINPCKCCLEVAYTEDFGKSRRFEKATSVHLIDSNIIQTPGNQIYLKIYEMPRINEHGRVNRISNAITGVKLSFFGILFCRTISHPRPMT